MADVVVEDVAQTGQNDEDYLDVDLGVENSELEHRATDVATTARDETIETVADDFDIEFDDFNEGGDSASPEPTHTISVDSQSGGPGALQDNIAVSEIDYHENEAEGRPDQPAAQSNPSQKSVDHENPEITAESFVENDDEISYETTVLEAARTTPDALNTRASPEPEVGAGAEQEANVLNGIQQGGAVDTDAFGDVHEAEQPHPDDLDEDHSHTAGAVEEHADDFKAASENEHLGAHQDHDWNEDHQHPAHGVIATYKGREYELFASPNNNDPETYFFASTEELYCPLLQMFHGIRDILGAELHATDELLLAVEELDLVIGSSSNEEFLEETTMHDILHLYLQLQANDGITDEPTLFVQLTARSPCEERFRFLKHAAQEGRGLTEFYESPADSDMDMDMASDHAYDEESDGDVAHREGELKVEESGDTVYAEGARELFFGEDATTTDEHTGDGEGLEGDPEVGMILVYEQPNGEAPLLEDGDVDAANLEDTQQANSPAEDAVETPEEKHQFGDNGQGGVTYGGDDFDNSTELQTSTADHQRSDFHLAEAARPSGNNEDESGEGLEDVVEQNEAGDVLSDALTTGNDSLSVLSFAESPAATIEEMLDAYLKSEDEEISDRLWKQLYDSPPVEKRSYAGVHDADLIDYSDDEDGNLGDDEISADGSDFRHQAAAFRLLEARVAEDEPIGYPDQADGALARTSSAEQDKTCLSATNPMLADSLVLPVPESHPSAVRFAAVRSFVTLNNVDTPPFPPAHRANLSDLQAEPSLGIRRETVIEVEYSSAVAAVDEEVPNDDVLDEEGDVDYSLTNGNVLNDETPAPDNFSQAANSKATSNTSTLQGDEDEIDYDEDEAAADEVDLEVDAVDEATVDDADEIDWNNDGHEGDADEDPSTTNTLSPGSSAKRIRDTDDGISLGDENGTPAKRQKL